MFKSNVYQNRIYLPKNLRELMKVANNDEIVFKIIQIGKEKVVIIEKSDFLSVQIYKSIKVKKDA